MHAPNRKGICTVSSFDPLSMYKLGTPRVVSTNEMKYSTERHRNPKILLLRAKKIENPFKNVIFVAVSFPPGEEPKTHTKAAQVMFSTKKFDFWL